MAAQQSASLLNLVEVGRRFRRSVNLARDTGSPAALDGYLVTPAVRRALSQITGGIDDAEGDRAWSLIGPYGSGKSAFAVFLADLLSPSVSPEAEAARRLLNGVERRPATAPTPGSCGADGGARAARHPPAAILGGDARTHLEGTPRRQAARAPRHPGVSQRVGTVAVAVCDVRRGRLLRGSGREDRQQHGRRGCC